ncbi:restriction endonuclease [Variovorax sp. KK3]|nr:restriction endonuclease [Variovorax sp. KK3]
MSKAIHPTDVRFIKLGRRGTWEQSSIEHDQVIRLGYTSPLHDESLAGNWKAVTKHWLAKRKGNKSTTTSDVRQIRDFYEEPETTLWFTFYARQLWWCFAKKQVRLLDDGSRVRAVKGQWQSTDIAGGALNIETLDDRLAKVGMYRGTICAVQPQVAEYLVRRINCEQSPDVQKAVDTMAQLRDAVEVLIRGMHWKDFELLTDLMFSRAGFQRLDVLGKTTKAIDLDLVAPVTRRRAFVQVKSNGTVASLTKSIEQFNDMPQYDDFFFICHTGKDVAHYKAEEDNIHVLAGPQLAELVIRAGLVEWLISKRS